MYIYFILYSIYYIVYSIYIYMYYILYTIYHINTYIYMYIYIYTYVTGAKYSVTRCSFGLLAASLAGTLREPCGTRAKYRYERNTKM